MIRKNKMTAPQMYILDIENLSQKDALTKFKSIINSDYFGQYELGSSEIVSDGLNVEIASCFSSKIGGRKRVRDLSKILSEAVSQIEIPNPNLRAALDLRTPEEMKGRLGIKRKKDDDEEPELSLYIRVENERDKTDKARINVVNLGLKKSFYEGRGLRKLYIQDRRALCKWYREIDRELREIIPF